MLVLLSAPTAICAPMVSAAVSALWDTKVPPAEPALSDTTLPAYSASSVRASLQTACSAPVPALALSAPWDSPAPLAPPAILDIPEQPVALAFLDTTQTAEFARPALQLVPTVCNAPMASAVRSVQQVMLNQTVQSVA